MDLWVQSSQKIWRWRKKLERNRNNTKQGVFDGLKGAQTSIEEVKQGYDARVGTGGVLPQSPQPPTSYVDPDTGIVKQCYYASLLFLLQWNQPKRKKEVFWD